MVTAELAHRVGAHDSELQPEPVEHLLLPLHTEPSRAHHQHRARPMPQQQLLHHQAGLDCLAQPDIVRDQQVRPWHCQGAHDRVELVVLDRDARPEWRLQRRRVSSRHRTPPHSVEECIESTGRVEPAGLWSGQFLMRDHLRARLELPDHCQLIAEAIVLDRRHAHEVLRPSPADRIRR
jgi:hypothetical protein